MLNLHLMDSSTHGFAIASEDFAGENIHVHNVSEVRLLLLDLGTYTYRTKGPYPLGD